jgi:hypothetical protein
MLRIKEQKNIFQPFLWKMSTPLIKNSKLAKVFKSEDDLDFPQLSIAHTEFRICLLVFSVNRRGSHVIPCVSDSVPYILYMCDSDTDNDGKMKAKSPFSFAVNFFYYCIL